MAQLNEGDGDGWNDKVCNIHYTAFIVIIFDICTQQELINKLSLSGMVAQYDGRGKICCVLGLAVSFITSIVVSTLC